MIDTDKYEGHTPADEWRLVFSEVNDCYDREMLGLTVRAYQLGQMQACDPEDYRVAQANQDLAREATLLLAEVLRLREATQQIIGNIELWCNGNTVPKDILMEKLKEMIE